MKTKLITSLIIVIITVIVTLYFGYWLFRLGISMVGIITIVVELLFGLPHRLVVKLWNCMRQQMEFIKLRRQQAKNPSQFLTLQIGEVNFNPKAYLHKEQDYLELSLSIVSGLSTEICLDRLIGKLSIDGSQPPEVFEIFDDLAIHKTGQDTTCWKQIIVKLSCEIKDYLHRRRELGQDVKVAVMLTGYHSGKMTFKKESFTEKIQVPKLPT